MSSTNFFNTVAVLDKQIWKLGRGTNTMCNQGIFFRKTQVQMDLKSIKHEIPFINYRLLKIWNSADLESCKHKPGG